MNLRSRRLTRSGIYDGKEVEEDMRHPFGKWPTVLVMLLGLCAVASVVVAQEFSADQITITRDKREVDTLYYRPDRWRIEEQGGAFPVVTIFRLDKKVIWRIMPKDKKYMEMPLTPEDLPLPEKFPGEIDRKVVGQEEIDGFLCDKMVIRYSSESGESGIAEMSLWISQQLKVPLRTEAPDLDWKTELKRIQAGPQADGLFEVPQGFESFVPPKEFLTY
jgi:hypothetical protein